MAGMLPSRAAGRRAIPASVGFLFAFFLMLLPTTSLASPFSPATVDSSVASCLQAVNADSLWNYIQTMQDFTTRHTNSDTTSSTVGIGAARRWVHDKFVEFANQGGNITASYHSFQATISGINKQHRNVVGEIPGTAPDAERRIYVIGAHLDSRNEDVADSLGTAFGADDDASGVACLLEAARVMSQKSWPHTYRFIAFTGEEQGLFGSAAYARDAFFANDRIAAMVQNDVMASIIGKPSPDSTVVMTDTTLSRTFADIPAEGPHRQLQRYLKAMGDFYVPIQNIVLIPAVDRPGRGSDHQSFNANGFTAIRYMEYLEELDRQHTTSGDTLGAHLDRNYLRRNAQVDVATLGNLGLAPAPPTGLTAGDIGDSTGFRLVWPSTNTEPDLAGYIVTQRAVGSLDYDSVSVLGLVNEFETAAIADSVYFGLSIYDSLDHRALIEGEVLGVLSSVPAPPMGLLANPDHDSVPLSWTTNAEGDLLGYNVYRSTTSGSGYGQINGSPVTAPAFDDITAATQTKYYYVVSAVDSSLNESGLSAETLGQIVSLDAGILFVDETKNGAKVHIPSDAVSDSVYAVMMTLTHDIWDVGTDGIPTLSDLGPYSSVLWVADDYTVTLQGAPVVTQLLPDGRSALEQYMGLGGNVMVVGWEPTKAFALVDSYPLDLVAGDFFYDWFGVDAVQKKGPARFKGGIGQGFFGDVKPDSSRLKTNWSGKLTRVEYATALLPDVTAGFLYDSDEPDSAYHNAPCATYRSTGTYRSIWWGFPLYHLETAGAQAALVAAMTFFGEIPSTGAPIVEHAGALTLRQNRPNPFRGETAIQFSIYGDRANVELTVFDLAGRRVRTLVSGETPGGVHEVIWRGANDQGHRVASGIYFYRLTDPNRTFTKKLVLLR